MTILEELPSEEEAAGGTERGFGAVFLLVFLVVALLPLIDGGPVRLWALLVAAGISLIALFRPALLLHPNRLWTKLGLTLSHIVNPIVLGGLFLFAITPMALIMRVAGKDLLDLRLDPKIDSYWILLDQPSSSMKNQF